MKLRNPSMLAALVAALVAVPCSGAAQAQNNVVKFGVTYYDTHSSTSGLSTTPTLSMLAGSDAETGDATTVIFVYERTLTPNIGAELVLGVPPRIKADATGPLAALTAQLGISNEILSAKNVAPTFLVNYYFGAPGDTWRPYLGAGLNYTHFTGIESSLATKSLSMSDSWGLALQGGVNYAINKEWGMFASVARIDVKSDVEAVAVIPGVPVDVTVKTKIDFKPWTYTAGVFYRF